MKPTNRTAFLSMLAWSIGTAQNPATLNEGYDVIVTGADDVAETFTDYAQHPFAAGRPPKIIDAHGHESTQSGRYACPLGFWLSYRDSLGLGDFGPRAQDDISLQMVRERGAIEMVDEGRLSEAIARVCLLWPSLPSDGVTQQYFERRIAPERAAYLSAGGVLASTETGPP